MLEDRAQPQIEVLCLESQMPLFKGPPALRALLDSPVLTDEGSSYDRQLLLAELRLSRAVYHGLEIAPRSRYKDERIAAWTGSNDELLKAFLRTARSHRLVKGLIIKGDRVIFLLFDKKIDDAVLATAQEFGRWLEGHLGLRITIPKTVQARYAVGRAIKSEEVGDYTDLALDFVPGGDIVRMIRDWFN